MSLRQAVERFTAALRNRYRLPLNAEGQMLTFEEGQWNARPMTNLLAFCDNDVDLELYKGIRESFDDVFNNWQRISRRGTVPYSDNAMPTELNGWSFNSATNQIRSTINSASLIGFISPQRFDRYTFEVILNSSSSDDDFIGVCIAHARNQETGNTEILTAMRGLNGEAPLTIDKNYNEFDVSRDRIAAVRNGLLWSNGGVATGPVNNSARPGWNSVTTGIKVKVVRDGDIVTVSTSQQNEVDYFEPATTILDLSADPRLEVFRGPQRYGYVSFSQANSTWDVLQRPGDRVPVYDTRTDTLWLFNGSDWVSNSSSVEDLVDKRLLHSGWLTLNPFTGSFYYLTSDNILREL